MSQRIPAIFDAGVFRPLEPVQLAEGTRVEVQLPAAAEECSAEETERQGVAAIAWSDFVEQTYGSCAGLGLERQEQGAFEVREPLA